MLDLLGASRGGVFETQLSHLATVPQQLLVATEIVRPARVLLKKTRCLSALPGEQFVNDRFADSQYRPYG